ncbi:glutamine amidotransferase:cyclase [Nadsonia fulvescens var. elongata DSM 6958]|uniref:Imidazole glycerol phosphate synthase hisHF n=1 Tax=Nadsonia fulvescens var. elongata DSM 6958 TaxID=857566 RepID=A0A1E3PH19_9ASCO|nr:glutamine amidotransferase:cyclase [Nadsonia fulvescens var. elongata DSM 6958]
MTKTVHIIDVESGNLRSMCNAIECLGYQPILIKEASKEAFAGIEKLIFPGVGNYGHFLKQLQDRGFTQLIKEYISSGRPLLGVCVGLQAFFCGSEESPNLPGLGLVNATLRKFDDSDKAVPHIGWNDAIREGQVASGQDYCGIKPYSKYYFVNSYACILDADASLKTLDGWDITYSQYGNQKFVSSISRGKVIATQFHPEKSGKAGLNILRSFLEGCDPVALTPAELTTSPRGLTRRVIACLDVRSNDSGDLVVTKGDQYDVREKDSNGGDGVRNLGKPVEMAEKYYLDGADEVTFLNITSFRNCPLRDAPMLEVLKQTSKTVFVPLTVGGGIRDIVDPDGTKIPALDVANTYFMSGADKVSIGSDSVIAAEAYYNRGRVLDGSSPMEQISKAYGVQAVVVSVDPKRVYVANPSDTKHHTIKTAFPGPEGQEYVWYQCTISGGRESRDLGVYELVQAVEAMGCGEVLLNCIDRDGSNAGFDLELIDLAKSAVKIPVIASSGAGKPEHFEQVFRKTKTDAALGAGMFHRGEYKVSDVKSYLHKQGLLVRDE